MPTLHVSDNTAPVKPLILVSGSIKHLTHSFISSLIDDFKLIVLNNPHRYQANENFFQVYNTALGTIKNLSDRLEYAVFFIQSPEDKRILEQLLPKIEKDKTRTLIVLPVSNFSEFSDIILTAKSIPSISFSIMGDIFGSDIPPSVSRVSKIVHSALTRMEAEFVGNELVSVYPISKTDVLKGIQYLLFSKEKEERVFFLFYEHPQTIISTIHLLKRIEPDLHILHDTQPKEFTSLLSHKELEQSIQSKSRLKALYLDEVFDGFEKSVRSISYSPLLKTLKKKKRRKSRLKTLSVRKSTTQTAITVVTCGILLFLVSNVLLTLSGVVFAKQAIESLKNGNFMKAGTELHVAKKSFELSSPVVTFSFNALQNLPIPAIAESYRLFTSGVNLTALAAHQLSQLETIDNGIKEEHLLESFATLFYLYFTAQSSSTYARLPYVDALTQRHVSDLLTTFSVLPEALGYKSEKRYLLLFQNNGELRPTGGFIGSVGDLRIKDGMVQEFTIQDVYDIDGQIKNHTEPPFIVRRYLQPHLYLRDSNFALDFQEAATMAAQLYKEGGGDTVDGVIGVDYEVLRKFIEIAGPLYLPTYKQTIDEKTGFDFIQSTIEDTFSPGNSQKKSILSEVFSQLLFKLENPKTMFAVAQTLPSLVEQKHILFAFKDPALQEIFTTQSYSGSLKPSLQSTADTFSEYFAINEANIGVNKANMAVTRSIAFNQTLSGQSVSSQATVVLDNSKGTEAYKLYLRFITSRDSEFEDLYINNNEVDTVPAITASRLYEAPTFNAPKELELTEDYYHDKKVFGFVYTVPAGRKDSISLTYSRSTQLPESSFAYNFIYQPQPGTSNTPFTFSLSLPENYIAHDEDSGVTARSKYSTSHRGTKDFTKSLQMERN